MFYRIKKIYFSLLHYCLGDWRYFLYDEYKHEKALIRNHYNSTTIPNNDSEYIIFMANGFCNHAGLCDRLKGMITVYNWCKNNQRKFRIFHQHPFCLENYLIPNKYDWLIDKNGISYNPKFVSAHHCMLNHLTDILVKSGDIYQLESKWLSQRMKNKRQQHHLYTNMYPENEIFGLLFQELFKPAPKVEKELSENMKKIGGEYISISFRFMQLLGDFKDCDGDTLNPTEQKDLIEKSIKVVESIKQRHPDIHNILITSDSSTFLDAVNRLSYVYIIKGKIGHINFESSDDINMKTFLDFLMIAHAQKVYLAKSGKMYNSDFAKRASMIYGRDFELITY